MQRAVRRARDFRERGNGPSCRGRVPRWRSGRPRVGAGDRGRWDESCQGSGAPPAGRRCSRDPGGDGVTERPLAGRTILVVASEERAEAIATALRRAGADAIPFPTVRIAPAPNRPELDRALRTWRSHDLVIFTSTNGVRTTIERARALRLELRTRPPRIAAVGPATKAVSESDGLVVVPIPDEVRTESNSEVTGPMPGRTVLLLQSRL